jgi:ribosomal protein S13
VTSSKSSSSKKIKIAAAVAAVASIGILFFQIKPISNRSTGAATPTVTPVKEIRWSVQIVGDAKPKDGVGSKYSTFICDQGVVNESLQLRELTNPAAKKQPIVKLLNGDARCGKDFDTIVIEGDVDETKVKRDYILAGSTKTGFIIQYEFSVSIKS